MLVSDVNRELSFPLNANPSQPPTTNTRLSLPRRYTKGPTYSWLRVPHCSNSLLLLVSSFTHITACHLLNNPVNIGCCLSFFIFILQIMYMATGPVWFDLYFPLWTTSTSPSFLELQWTSLSSHRRPQSLIHTGRFLCGEHPVPS